MRLFLSLLAGSIVALGSWQVLRGLPIREAEEHLPLTVALGFLTGAFLSVFVSPLPREEGRGRRVALAMSVVLAMLLNLMWVAFVVGYQARSQEDMVTDFVCLLPAGVMTALLAAAWRLTPFRLLGWAVFVLASQGFLAQLFFLKEWLTPVRAGADGGLLLVLLVVRGLTRKTR